MLLALIYALIVVVIGAICFYLIDKFVRDGRLGRDSARATADTRRELLTEQLWQLRDVRRNPLRCLANA
jgi:hypothetical protein